MKAYQSVRKVNAPSLPASAQAVLVEQDRLNGLAQTGRADGLALKAAQARNNEAFGLELIKAARSNPHNRVAVGDAALLNFLRHGRP